MAALAGVSMDIIAIIVIEIIWEIFWKGLALWRASRNGHKVWFWFILILNTAGILPIIYIVFYSKSKSRKTKHR